jgi:hypothetical protein
MHTATKPSERVSFFDRKDCMASNSRKRQTMAKIKRERAVKEKRALKLEKKEARKQAARDALNGTPAEVAAPPEQEGSDPDQLQ